MTPAKLRAMADTLQKEIDQKRRPRLENTPKRQKEAAKANIEANHLERVVRAARKLADADDAAQLPQDFRGLTKSALSFALLTRTDCHGGYYSIRDTGEYCDKSPLAVRLREWLSQDIQQTPEQRRAQKLQEMLRDVKLRPIPGYFPTPAPVARRMIELAEMPRNTAYSVLEPSAGSGNLADAVRENGNGDAHCIERNQALAEILQAKGYDVWNLDFMDAPIKENRFDRILMNPPFEDGWDMAHIRRAYHYLKPGGVLVAVASAGTLFRQGKDAQDFRRWLTEIGADTEELPRDSFKGVNAVLFTIRKPDDCETCGECLSTCSCDYEAELDTAEEPAPAAQEQSRATTEPAKPSTTGRILKQLSLW